MQLVFLTNGHNFNFSKCECQIHPLCQIDLSNDLVHLPMDGTLQKHVGAFKGQNVTLQILSPVQHILAFCHTLTLKGTDEPHLPYLWAKQLCCTPQLLLSWREDYNQLHGPIKQLTLPENKWLHPDHNYKQRVGSPCSFCFSYLLHAVRLSLLLLILTLSCPNLRAHMQPKFLLSETR